MERKKADGGAESTYEWMDSILFALTAVFLIFTFAVKTYIVDGTSMVPTLQSGDRVFAESLFYAPQQGDIVILDDNNNLSEPLVKRVIATGGQTVDIDSSTGRLTVDGAEVGFRIKNLSDADNLRGDTQYPLTVPEGYLFVMGDNRGASLDSRYTRLGLIDERCVLGREFFALRARG